MRALITMQWLYTQFRFNCNNFSQFWHFELEAPTTENSLLNFKNFNVNSWNRANIYIRYNRIELKKQLVWNYWRETQNQIFFFNSEANINEGQCINKWMYFDMGNLFVVLFSFSSFIYNKEE